MNPPVFTIATITYNSARWVKNVIESVLASNYTDFEYLISDDCSTDNTWDIIQEYNDPRIRSWRNERNIGEYPNRNKVLSYARGKYLLYVDGDDILYKYTLRNISEFLEVSPNAVMIWGVPPVYVDFAVMPYALSSEQILRILYESERPFSIIGFAETFFNIDVLKRIGGLPENYVIGDTYIRKRMSFEGDVLLVPMGMVFWRRSNGQASQKASRNFAGFLESFQIDMEIISLSNLNNKEELRKVIKGSFLRRLFSHTIFKFKFLLFFKLLNLSKLSINDFRYLFKTYDFTYSPAVALEKPLINNFNFKI
jgi:glycosyltransferase involved in cell wall biosynthesis